MKIRQKLTLQFSLMAGVIMLLFSLTVYFASATYRRDDFYQRLESRAYSTARLLIEVDEIDADLLNKIEEDNPISLPDEKIIILNYKNEILYSTDTRNVIIYDEDLLTRIRTSGEVRTKSGRYELMGILFPEEYNRFVVLSAARDIYGFDKLKNLRVILLLINGIFLILYYPAGWLFAARAFSPISKVIERVEEISIASLDLRLDEGNGRDELAHLAHTFNLMLDRLETAFDVQKDFISNASHELRTPLTAIRGQLEVLLMKERPSGEYRETTEAVLEDIRKLNRLLDRLLLMAHASSEGARAGFREVRIDEILWQARDELLKHEKEYSVTIALDENISDIENLIIRGDEQLLMSAVTNIMENGCKYSPDRSVRVFLSHDTKHISVGFTDNGPGIAEDEIERIFESFYRSKVTAAVRGHGIGLSLAKQIIDIHHGEISVYSRPGEGTTITLSFPADHFSADLIGN
ncbi:MAG: ATP-binding protein [Bacteroidales bacterium]|jgi:signal transduction histidine kinase|nr:ATP-binding protein [Bacteroidales bacterium]